MRKRNPLAATEQNATTLAAAPNKPRVPKKNGRPVGSEMLTRENTAAICEALEMAVPLNHAAGARGISEGTVNDWMEKGRKGIEPYAAFAATISRARHIAVQKLASKALEGGPGSGNASWMLGVRFRQEYGPIQRLEHSGPDGAPIAISAQSVRGMTDEELAAEYERSTSAGAKNRALASGDGKA